MVRPIILYGNPILRKKAAVVENIDESVKSLIFDMIESCQTGNDFGLAAPQVGVSLAIFVAAFPQKREDKKLVLDKPRVFINPRLANPSKEYWSHGEGCLSIPGVYEDVSRPLTITITAQDIDGKEFTETLTGWPARICMHENDHINGNLFIDRIDSETRKAIEPTLREIKKKSKK